MNKNNLTTSNSTSQVIGETVGVSALIVENTSDSENRSLILTNPVPNPKDWNDDLNLLSDMFATLILGGWTIVAQR
ncbi:hypothetical protein KA344_09215 [bacterium]|jgi:hypothetical protein|nr:hypothetical protein [bacterium]